MHVFISKDSKISKINKITISNMGLVRRYHYKGRNDVIKSCHAMMTNVCNVSPLYIHTHLGVRVSAVQVILTR